jgi:hypothetical protein
MKDGKCPKCGSAEIYMSNSPYPDSIFAKSNTSSIETFTTSAYICLDCSHLEIYVSCANWERQGAQGKHPC